MTNYIGIDIGKKSLHIYLPGSNNSFAVTNSYAGFNEFIFILNKYYSDFSKLIIVFEPTGGYERKVKEFLIQHKLNFSIVHPNKVRNFAKAKGLLAKTDKIDSKLIYDYAVSFNIETKIEYSTEAQQKLHLLIKRREQINSFRNQEIARLDNQIDSIIVKSLNQHLKYLDNQLKSIEEAIEKLGNSEHEIKEKIARLTSIPGIGKVLATTVICEIPELGNIEFSKLTSLVGLAPFARSSGQYNGKRSIFAGRGNLRKVLYMAALASLRCNHKLKAFYDRLISNHKPPKVALVALMRKLLAYMHALFKNNSFWCNSYVHF